MSNKNSISLDKFLKSVFLFSELNPAELNLLSSLSHIKKIKKNEYLFHAGDTASKFFVLAYGKLKIFVIGPNGSELTLHMHKDGDLIAEAAIFSEEVYPASCIALQDGLLIVIPRKGFVDLINKKPGLSLKLMSAYSKRMRQFVKQIEDISSLDVKERLIKYILDNAEGKTLKLEMSKKDLALLLGTTPETLSRVLNSLKKNNLIDVKNRLIQIRDTFALSSKILS